MLCSLPIESGPKCFRALLASLAFAPQFAAGAVDFTKDVQPILENHCYDCHGEDKAKSVLRLDHPLGLLRGGESGEPLLVPGDSGGSYLYRRVTTKDRKDAMPPKGKRLSDEEVATLREWIDTGAAIPGEAEARKELAITTTHWSFQPVVRPPAPIVDGGVSHNEIDAFILQKLRSENLAQSPPAERGTLIRRLFLVAHGLPPTPQEVADFVSDPQPDAYERLVDRVLNSPRFAERLARHWMDVVRYADSNGFETNRERKTAWYYRDWMIQSFQEDKPYDRFIREQIAGDKFGVDAATGFLVAGQYDIVKSPDINLTLMQRQDELTDMVNTTSTAFLGLTMGCARCHNHKFDPILQKDYYSMQAVFEGVHHGERPLREKVNPEAAGQRNVLRDQAAALTARWEDFRKLAAEIPAPAELRAPVNAAMNTDSFDPVATASLRFFITQTSGAEPCIDELEIHDTAGFNVAPQGRAAASGTLPGYAIHQLEHVNDGRTGNDRSWISNTPGGGWVRVDFPAPVVVRDVVWGRDRSGRLQDRLATGYRIEITNAAGEWKTVAGSEDRQPYGGKVDPAAFIDRLPEAAAAAARQIRAELDAVEKEIASLGNVPVGGPERSRSRRKPTGFTAANRSKSARWSRRMCRLFWVRFICRPTRRNRSGG